MVFVYYFLLFPKHFPSTFAGSSDFFFNCCLLYFSFHLSSCKRRSFIAKFIAHIFVSYKIQLNNSFLLATMLCQVDQKLSHVSLITIDQCHQPKPSWWLLEFIFTGPSLSKPYEVFPLLSGWLVNSSSMPKE